MNDAALTKNERIAALEAEVKRLSDAVFLLTAQVAALHPIYPYPYYPHYGKDSNPEVRWGNTWQTPLGLHQ